MERIVAVITSYNRADFIPKCLESLLDSADDDLEVQALVMDNGSSDGSPELAAGFGARVRVEHTAENQPVIGVINRGLKIALEEMEPTYIILMNEDTQFRPGSLAALVPVVKDHPGALITPLQINYYHPDRVDSLALTYAQNAEGLFEDVLMGRPLKPAYPVRKIIGAGMFARREVWERLGFWDELYSFYGPDDDYCNRALHLGYELLLVPQAQLLHAHGNFNAEIRATNIRASHRRWHLITQKRYMLILKNPDEAFARCIARLVGRYVANQWKLFFSFWPRGMLLSTLAFWDCISKLPRVAAARRDQFGAARRAVGLELPAGAPIQPQPEPCPGHLGKYPGIREQL